MDAEQRILFTGGRLRTAQDLEALLHAGTSECPCPVG